MDDKMKLTRRLTMGLAAGAALTANIPRGARAAPVRGGHLIYGR
jgi:hypothetical protein